MMRFFADMADSPFLLSGLYAGLFASLACGIAGPYVVTRRMVFLAAAIAHIALGGVGASIYATYRWPHLLGWLDPLIGAGAVSVIAAVALAWISHRTGEHLDTVIGAFWAASMAGGVLLVKLTPGYNTELMSYLFGNLSLVQSSDLALMAVLDVGVVLVALLFHKRFLAVSLDEEQARLQGLDPLRTDMVLLILVALTVVLLTRVVGLILVIALISLPAAAAIRHTARLSGAIFLTILFCVLLTTAPRIAVYGTRISPEPAIVLAAVGLYAVAVLASRLRRARS